MARRTGPCTEHRAVDIRVEASDRNQGRHAAQNLAAREAKHDVLVATDADTEFAPGFLRAIAAPFVNSKIGVVGGIIRYRDTESEIAASIGTYRGVEYRLRAAEQALGVLPKTDGPCTAYRRSIWCEIEEFEDLDHVVVIFGRQSGFQAVQASNATCWDTPNARWRQEIKARARMTRKGLLSIHKRWGWVDVSRDPGFTAALYSHRHARYLSPMFLLAALLGAGYVAARRGVLVPMSAGVVGALGILAVVATRNRQARQVLGRLGSFLLANAGFALGLWTWLRGDRSGRYTPARRLQ
jgi:hypothetical protein